LQGIEADLRSLIDACYGLRGPETAIITPAGQPHDPHQALKAFHRYRDKEGAVSQATFLAEPDIHNAVSAFLSIVLEGQIRNLPRAPGCLLVNCAATVTSELPEVGRLLDETFAGTQKMIARRFGEEVEKGALPADFPIIERARLLVDFMNAQAVRIRAGEEPSKIEAEIPQKVRLVLS